MPKAPAASVSFNGDLEDQLCAKQQVPLRDAVIGGVGREGASAVIVEFRASEALEVDIADRNASELRVHPVKRLRLELQGEFLGYAGVLEKGNVRGTDRLAAIQAPPRAEERRSQNLG